MVKTAAEKIFDKYNPVHDVVRAPHGRAKVRPMLDDYARAAVNLYGIISLEDFVEIFNSQQVEQTTAAEVYILLLPNVLRDTWYAFYKDSIIHYSLVGAFEWADHLERAQRGKPRYIPDEGELLRYRSDFYVDSDHWDKWRDVLYRQFGYKATQEVANDIQDYMRVNLDLPMAMAMMEHHGFSFPDREALQEFVKALIDAMNNSRCWENKGYSPAETLGQREESNQEEQFRIQSAPRQKPNETCVCGSKKKYKLCCGLVDAQGTAQITRSEGELFSDTFVNLLSYVNESEDVADLEGTLEDVDEDLVKLHAIRDALWEKPSLIADYLATETGLSDEAVRLLQSWLHNHVSGDFVVVAYTPEHAIFCQMQESGPRLFAVKGIMSSVASSLSQPLPIFLNAVLLPFKDVIIHDSFLAPYEITITSNLKRAFKAARAHAEAESGVITRL